MKEFKDWTLPKTDAKTAGTRLEELVQLKSVRQITLIGAENVSLGVNESVYRQYTDGFEIMNQTTEEFVKNSNSGNARGTLYVAPRKMLVEYYFKPE